VRGPGRAVEHEHDRSADGALDPVDRVAPGRELALHVGGDARVQLDESPRDHRFFPVRVGPERILVVGGAEAWRGHGLAGHHPELDVVEQAVERGLFL